MTYHNAPPPDFKVWIDAGLAAHHAGDIERAVVAYRHVLVVAPDNGPALNLLGTGLLQLGSLAEAVSCLERAVRRQRRDPFVLANLAQAYLAVRRYVDAGEAFRKASQIAPGEPQFHIGVAAALALQGKLDDAQAMLQRLSARFPNSPLVWLNLGNVLRDQQRPQDAASAYRQAFAIDPHQIEARNGLGSVLHSMQCFAEAEQHYRECLRIAPDYGRALYNLASVLIDLGSFVEAEAVCRQIVAAEPESSQGHTFLGASLAHQGRLAEALPCYREAARLAPDNPHNAALYGTGLCELGRVAEGRRWLADALDASPDNNSTIQLLSTALLAHGCVQDGWDGYVRRPAAGRIREKSQEVTLTTVLPADLENRAVCVLREQGLGDEIFFLRYARVLAERGARVSYRAAAKIADLIRRTRFIDTVLPENGPLPDADAYILVGDLPLALGQTPQSLLPSVLPKRSAVVCELRERISLFWPPLPESIAIEPGSAQVRMLRERLAALGPPPYIGLTWRAGTPPEEQGAVSWTLYKEVKLPAFATALRNMQGTLLALQRKPAAGEIDRLAQALERPLHDLTDLNEDLEGMLALLFLIDDYVGVSNTNMHLRAAVQKTARVLVPVPAEWRWLQSRRYSPWFPGFPTYRQSLDGDWTQALSTLKHDLEQSHGVAPQSTTP